MPKLILWQSIMRVYGKVFFFFAVSSRDTILGNITSQFQVYHTLIN